MRNFIILPTGQMNAFFTFAIEKRFRKKGSPLTEINSDTVMAIIHSKPNYNKLGKANATALMCSGIEVKYNPTPDIPSTDEYTGHEYYWDYEYTFNKVETSLMTELFKIMGRDPYQEAWSGHPQYM